MGCACIKTCSRSLIQTEFSEKSIDNIFKSTIFDNDSSNNSQESDLVSELSSSGDHSKNTIHEPKEKKFRLLDSIDCKLHSSSLDEDGNKLLAKEQYLLLTPSLIDNIDHGYVILESSVISLPLGQVAILPWVDNDCDILNNFWVDKDPPVFNAIHSKLIKSTQINNIEYDLNHHPSHRCQKKKIHHFSPNTPSFDVYLDGWHICEKKWTDPEGHISLSSNQQRKFHKWKRISELINFKNCSKNSPIFLIQQTPKSNVIRQGFIGDCSFLASLAALSEYEHKFDTPVISNILYPQQKNSESKKAYPIFNMKGMYACRLYLNGVPRKVLVDDFLPVNSNGKVLAAHSSVENEYWVSLMEKCFAKLLGSTYAIQGSNPGSDLYLLTGWIPDIIPFRNDVLTASPSIRKTIYTGSNSFNMECPEKWNEIWDLLYEGLESGKCVACLGTSDIATIKTQSRKFPENVCQKSGIVAKHAYAVINNAHVDGIKLLFVKNPWCCTPWKGRFSPYDKHSWTNELQNVLNYDSQQEIIRDNGYFWICWEDVIKWFSHLYICWNPKIFSHHTSIHSKWINSPAVSSMILPDDTHLVAFDPQFLLEFDAPENVDQINCWILLSHHLRERSAKSSSKYLAVHIFSGKKRIICPENILHHGIYSNGECTLVKLQLTKPNSSFIFDACSSPFHENTYHVTNIFIQPMTLVISQYSQKNEFNFTVRVSSNSSAKITHLPPLVSSQTVSKYLKGCFTEENAGGSSNDLRTYFKNPHIRLYVPYKINITLILEMAKEYSLNIRVFSGLVSTPRSLKMNKPISSGQYRMSCCYIQCELDAGIYTVVLSTFNKHEYGEYQLSVFCDKQNSSSTPLVNTNKSLFWSPDYELFHMPTFNLPKPLKNKCHHLTIDSSKFETTTEPNVKYFIQLTAPQCIGDSFINASIKLNVQDSVYTIKVVGMTLYQSNENDSNALIVCKSDLEGGYDYSNHTISTTALSAYEKEGCLTISQVSLNTSLFPYYICIYGLNIFHDNLNTPILNDDQDIFLKFEFIMQIISDQLLSFT